MAHAPPPARSTMHTHSIRSIALSIACFAVSAPLVHSGQLLIDTGTPDNSVLWSFTDWQYFGSQFTVSSATQITEIDAYFGAYYNDAAGTIAYSLHADAGDVVGAVLNSTTLPVAGGSISYDWYGVSGLNWNIGPGTYWVSFVPSAGAMLEMPGEAPNPMLHYAQGGLSGFTYFDLSYLKTGVRIYGDQTPNNTPDGGVTAFMLSAALAALVALRRRVGV